MKRIAYILLAATGLLTLNSCRFVHVSDELNEKALQEGFNWNGDASSKSITASNNYATRAGFDKGGMPIAVNNAGDGTLTLVTNVNGIGKGIFIADGNVETIYVDNTPTVWTFECIDEELPLFRNRATLLGINLKDFID